MEEELKTPNSNNNRRRSDGDDEKRLFENNDWMVFLPKQRQSAIALRWKVECSRKVGMTG
jgi:hypothetical protein